MSHVVSYIMSCLASCCVMSHVVSCVMSHNVSCVMFFLVLCHVMSCVICHMPCDMSCFAMLCHVSGHIMCHVCHVSCHPMCAWGELCAQKGLTCYPDSIDTLISLMKPDLAEIWA